AAVDVIHGWYSNRHGIDGAGRVVAGNYLKCWDNRRRQEENYSNIWLIVFSIMKFVMTVTAMAIGMLMMFYDNGDERKMKKSSHLRK
ncbi:unnamed protein product, partial [Ceratitis capitata]